MKPCPYCASTYAYIWDDSVLEGLENLIKRVTMSVDLRLILREQLGPWEGMKDEATGSLSVPQLMS